MVNEKTVTEEKSQKNTEQRFSKEQILTSAKYANRRDLVDALLDDDKKYTMKEVDAMIEKFMKGRVK